MADYVGSTGFSTYTLEASGVASVAFSADDTRIYVARQDGKIDVFDAASHSLVTTWNVGTSLGGISVSDDGSFLMTTERGIAGQATLYRVSTSDGQVQSYTTTGSFYDVVVGTVGAFVSGSSLRQFNNATQTFTAVSGGAGVTEAVMTERGLYTLIVDENFGGSVRIFTGGSLGAAAINVDHLGSQAMNDLIGVELAALFSDADEKIHFYDSEAGGIGFSIPIGEQVDGLAFDASGYYLYVYKIESGVLAKYSFVGDGNLTGTLVDQFAVGTAALPTHAGYGDQIHLSADGRYITLTNNSTGKLQLLDLSVRDDTFVGTVDADNFTGLDGNDTYYVNHAGDTIVETFANGDDRALLSVSYTLPDNVERAAVIVANGLTVTGSGGSNVLTGNVGDDVLDGGLGGDTMIGGGGNDRYYVDSVGDTVTEAAGEGVDEVFAKVGYTLTANVEKLTLIGSAAVGTGNGLANTITGTDAVSNLFGMDGNDTLNGAGGNDLLDGGAGVDTMDGGTGDDRFIVDNGFETVFEAAGEGNDRVEASVSWTMTPEQEIETLTTTDAAGTGAIDLMGNEFANRITGNAGNNILQGNDGDDSLFGLAGHDVLTGGLGKDMLEGGIGRDWLDGGAGHDMMSGGMDDDSYVVDTALDTVLELAGEGNDTVRTTLSSYTLTANVENLVYFGSSGFAGTGNDLANILDTRGASGNDMLKGMAGADTLYSGAGSDSLEGGTGVDSMTGGLGDDTYYVDDAADQAIELSGEGSDTVRSTAASYTLGANIETLILMGAAANGTGNVLDNVLIGSGGHNILDGGAGADRMEGGLGDDTYRIDNANDLIVETGVGIDKAIASVSYTLRAGVSVETLTTDNDAGTAAINLTGNELANRVVGNAGANTLHGGSGNDRLEGLDGSDTLWGDAGTDLLIGGNGNDLYVVTDLGDTIVETATGGVDRVSLSLASGGTFTLGTYVETLVVAGAGVEAHGNAQDNRIVNSATGGSSIWGEGGNDTLEGGAVAEALHGGIGNDRITGGAGSDRIWGEAGNDLFVFATGSGADEVVDFTRGADRIDLTGYGISSLAQVQAMLSQSGANAVIDLGSGNSITLDNIVGSQLAASDFVFAAAPPSLMAAMVEEVMLPTNDFLSGGGAAKAFAFDL